MGNIRRLYIREHYVIHKVRENFISRKFPSTWYMCIPIAIMYRVSCFLQELANLMKQESLRPGDVLEIFLPAQNSNMWLNQDVVLIDR